MVFKKFIQNSFLDHIMDHNKLRYIEKGRFYIMGGIIGRVLCVHDITIRFIIILIIYIQRTQPIGTYLLGGGAIGTDLQVSDMSPGTTNEEGVGRIPPQGVLQADRTATAEGSVQRLCLPNSGGCNGRSGVAGDGDLRLRPP